MRWGPEQEGLSFLGRALFGISQRAAHLAEPHRGAAATESPNQT